MDNTTYYGAEAGSDRIPLRQRLREMYDPEDFVTVQNVDTQPVTYQFTNPSDHETFSDYPGHKDTSLKKPPVRLTLKSGETKLCPAYEADQFFENLVKQIALRNVQTQVEKGEISDRVASADWTDPVFQKQILSKAFVGKKDVLAAYNDNVDAVEPSVEEELALETPAQRGRTPKVA